MCTTYVLSELIGEFSELDIIGYPRLVRLNPMIPWKTRGNGALSVQLGIGRGKRHIVGEFQGEMVYGYQRGENVEMGECVEERVRDVIECLSQFDDRLTNPAYILCKKRPTRSLYWQAVKGIVRTENVKKQLRKINAVFRGYKNQRGLVGAAAAISWVPRDRTYEIIAYREKGRWGTKRIIDPESVIRMDKRFKETFNNYDYLNRHVCIAPNSPCPVLFGIRGERPDFLPAAMHTIESERIERWLIYQTNQGTDEHLVRKRIASIGHHQSVILKGKVAEAPRTVPGGHVIFALSDTSGEVDCAVYEPARQFRDVARRLVAGDNVIVYGGVRKEPRTINVEKLKIEALAMPLIKAANPLCPGCNKRMKSSGRERGYRCIRCGLRAGEENAEFRVVKRNLQLGFYEPPPSARRHIAKPLKRMQLISRYSH